MTTREVLEWWERATPVPYHSAPTLMRPAETHALGGGEHIEVHTDRSGTYRLILVRSIDRRESISSLFTRDGWQQHGRKAKSIASNNPCRLRSTLNFATSSNAAATARLLSCSKRATLDSTRQDLNRATKARPLSDREYRRRPNDR